MEARSVWEYMWFGTALRYLQDLTGNEDVHADGWVLSNIDGLLAYLDRFKLVVTARAAEDLRRVREHLATTPDGYLLSQADAQLLTRTVTDLRRTLEAEAYGSVAYILLEKRFEVTKLLNRVWELMDDGVYGWLPDIAKQDFVDGGRCIALEVPTAAAFHVLRGTESALRQFYTSIVQRGRAPQMWGPMVASLRNRSRNRPPDELLNHLDNIRTSFRNPTQHPEKVYDIQEA